MKSPLLFTRLATAILLFSSSPYLSAQTVVFSEDFSGFTTGTHASPSTYDLSASLDTKTSVPGWTGFKVYSAGGEIKLGTSEVPGWIETPEVSLSGYDGDMFVKFDVARWPDDAASVRVMLSGSQIGETISPSSEFQSVEIPLTKGISSCKIKFESLAKRFFLDNVRIVNQIPTGYNEALQKVRDIRIYPNPATDYITIDGLSGSTGLRIYNAGGKEVYSLASVFGETGLINITGLYPGIYLIRIIFPGKVHVSRFVKY